MPKFDYTAVDAEGRDVRAQLDAADEAAVRAALAGRGLAVREIVQVAEVANERADGADDRSRLSNAEAAQLTARLAELTEIDLPLAPGLLAAAEEIAAESGGAKLAAMMRELAGRIERGASLESIMDEAGDRLPSHLRGIVKAGVDVGRLDETLNWLVQQQRAARRLRWRISSALAYPLVLLGATFALILLFSVFVLPQFRKMFDDFDMSLPPLTEFMFSFFDAAWKFAIAVVVIVVVGWAILRTWGGLPAVHNVLHGIPLVGKVYLYNGLSELGGLLAILTKHGMPLPEALRLAGDAVRDRALGAACTRLADELAAGEPLASRLAAAYDPLRRLQPLLQWGDAHNALPAAFEYLEQEKEAWAEHHAPYLRVVIPPFVFVMVLTISAWVVIGLFLPLIKLVQVLS